MKHTFVKKIRAKSGMTISELLVATAIILLVSAGMVAAIRQASDNFAKEKAQSEAKILCSSLEATVGNELRYTRRVRYESGEYRYVSKMHGDTADMAAFAVEEDTAKIFTVGGESRAYGIVVLYFPKAAADENEVKLLADGMYPLQLRAYLKIQSLDPDTGLFTVFLSIVDKDGNELIRDTFTVENLNQGLLDEG